MTIFKAGDKVKVVNYPEHVRNGYEATVTRNDPSQDISGLVPVFSYFITFEDERMMWMQTRYLELITAAPQEDEYAGMSLEEQVAVLTEELYQVSRSYVAASTHRDRLQHDIDVFTSTMRDVKDVEGWCDDGTNTIIMRLNDRFDVHYIEPYQQEHEIEYEITASVMVRGTVMVTASSQDAAREFFDDDPDSFITPHEEAMDELRSLGWDNIEVESI